MKLVTDVLSSTVVATYRTMLPSEAPFEPVPPRQAIFYRSHSYIAERQSSTGDYPVRLPDAILPTETQSESSLPRWDILYHPHSYMPQVHSSTGDYLRSLVNPVTVRGVTEVLGGALILLATSTGIAEPVLLDPGLLPKTGRPSRVYLLLKNRNVTSPLQEAGVAERELLAGLDGMRAEEIEDGMTSALGAIITGSLEKYGGFAMEAVGSIISAEKVDPEIMSHVLRWLGRMKHPESFGSRLGLLRHSLLSSSPVIRDGAALGLAALGSPLAVAALRAAIQREGLPELRKDLEQVLDRLERQR